MTKREAIDLFRQKIREQTSDSTYSNFMLYKSLEEQLLWLIRRDISKVYKSNELFQLLENFSVQEVDPSECGLDTNCKVYRTTQKLPEIWTDDKGPVIKLVSSVDFKTSFTPIQLSNLKNKVNNPYHKIAKERYYYFLNDYLYFVDFNPHLVSILALFKDDLSLFERKCYDCQEDADCIPFLDTKLLAPAWTIAEAQAKALQQIAGVSKRLREDSQIDKNTNRIA